MRNVLLTILMVAFIGVLGLSANPIEKPQRNYMLVFDVRDYSSQLKEAVECFFNKVLQKGDQLIVFTPMKLVGYSPKKLETPKEQLIDELIKILKTDISSGSSQYRTILNEMMSLAVSVTEIAPASDKSGAKSLMENYLKNRENLVNLRGDIEQKLLGYSNIFKKTRGENHLLMFLQQEYRPIPNKKAMSELQESPLETGFQAGEVFLGESYKIKIDYKKIVDAFKSSQVRFHFLYFQDKQTRERSGIDYIDNLGDLYNTFSIISRETNGLKIATAKPEIFVEKVGQIVEGKVSVEVVEEKME